LKGVKKRPWCHSEDSTLTKLVTKFGSKNWCQIANKMQNRDGKQCRERWHNHLNPEIRKDQWSDEEEWILY